MDLIKVKSNCKKETANKIKRQCTGWEKIFANELPNKGLISTIYKQWIKLNIKKPQTTQFLKWAEGLNRHFPMSKWASLIAQLAKNLPIMQETPVQFVNWEEPWRTERYPLQFCWASLVDQLVNNLPVMQDTWV